MFDQAEVAEVDPHADEAVCGSGGSGRCGRRVGHAPTVR
jgi:hypothetical protein